MKKNVWNAWEERAEVIGVNPYEYDIKGDDTLAVAVSKDMLHYGISWCTAGKDAVGKKTNCCGDCIYCNYSDCDCISDAAHEDTDNNVILIKAD